MRTLIFVACPFFVMACGGATAADGAPAGAPEPVLPGRPPAGTTPPIAGSLPRAPSANCPNEQLVPRPTSADDASTYASFLSRNGAGWNTAPPAWTWDALLGRIEFSYRTDPNGAKLASVSPADAAAAASAFVVTSWDLLGYRSSGNARLATATPTPVDASYSGGGFAWRVEVDSDEAQAGYETLEGAVQHLHFIVDVADDGTVRQFTSGGAPRVPTLTLGTTPVVGVDVARAAVLGLPMQHVAGPYQPPEDSFDYGPIGSTDIVAVGLSLTSDAFPSFTRLRLAHTFTVAHDRYHATLYVDACTGKRLGP
jgi:hypothetical protein